MKKIITGFILMFVAAVAFALPSPKMIEEALMTKHYAEAKGMIAEVLREKPTSARAHLLNAYVLVHVDHNAQAANAELNIVNGLEKGDVKTSPLYGRVVSEIMAAKPVAQVPAARVMHTTQPAPAYVQPVKSTTNFTDILYIVLIGAAVVAILVLIYKGATMSSKSANIYISRDDDFRVPTRRDYPVAPSSPSGAYYERPTQSVAQERIITQQPIMMSGGTMGGGMGAFGTAASVAGGVVAGNMISDALHHGHRSHNSSYEDEEYERRRREREQRQIEEQGWQASSPVYQPAPEPVVSYETERRSFSSGSDDSWSSSSSSSSFSSSDSGSSSWDSGSDSSSSSSWD